MADVKVNLGLMRGALRGIEDSAGADGSRFMDQIRFHRISGRLLEAADDLPDALDAARRRVVQSVRDEELLHIERTLATIRTIVPRIEDEHSPIQVKGTSVGEHLGTSLSRLRPSSDVDLIGSDLSFLSKLGYRLTQEGICHEVGTFSRPRLLAVDVHKYLPSWRTDGDRIRSTRIDLDTIRRHCEPSELWAGRAGIPDVTLAAAIICSHLYVDYLEHPVFREAPVRLAEIFEFDELQRHARFDPARFDVLTRELGLAQAREFVRAVIELVQGEPTQLTTRVEIARGVLRTAILDRNGVFDSAHFIDRIAAGPAIELAASGDSPVVVSGGELKEGVVWNRDDDAERLPTLAAGLTRISPDTVRLEITAKLVSGYYKDELRLTLSTGSVAVQRNTVDGGIRLRQSGPGPWEFRSRADQGELGLQVDLDLPPGRTLRAIVGAHSFPEALTDDWNDFYRMALASGCLLLELHG